MSVALSRLAVLAGCAGFALVAVGSGMDRLAVATPALARQVPALFAAESLRMLGPDALAQPQPGAAMPLARNFLAAAPVDPAASALLGAARLKAGDAAGAEAAFRIAGQMGWRVPLTQTYWLNRALALGDFTVAAQRLDALLRQQPLLLRARALVDPIESSDAGRAALIERLAQRPNWLAAYAGDVETASLPVLQTRAAVLGALAMRGVRVGCDGAAPAVSQLAALGDPAVAKALWQGQCPEAQAGMLADGHFRRALLDRAPTPFDWAFSGGSELDLRLTPAAGGRQLVIGGTPRDTGTVASQLLALEPGRYRLNWRAPAPGAAGAPLLATLSCARSDDGWLPASYDAAAGTWSAAMTVDGGCPGHWLNFAVRAGVSDATLAEVSVAPAR